jgi:tetraacyldisaccharide-1-P 4'-kinase
MSVVLAMRRLLLWLKGERLALKFSCTKIQILVQASLAKDVIVTAKDLIRLQEDVIAKCAYQFWRNLVRILEISYMFDNVKVVRREAKNILAANCIFRQVRQI